jgi:lipid-A-disaccharide synthase
MKKIIIVAGDKSGDLYGGFLGQKLSEKSDEIEIYSFGGEKLAAHSKQLINLLEHSVTGLVEVLFSLKKIIATFNQIITKIHEIKPDLIILIDFPDFNLRLAKKLNKKYPLFYYVSPQVWAWRKERVKEIKKYVDKMVVIFNFEKDFYQKEGVDALYFGHPLLEIVKKTNPSTQKIITLMPGSRRNEIKKHLPVMLAAAKIIKQALPDYNFRIIRPPNINKMFYKDLLSGMDIVDIEIKDHSYQAIEESAFVIASSGTTTVELAILEVPFILMYKVNSLSWFLVQRLVNVKFAGMVNILAGRKIIEEFLQDQASAENLAKAAIEVMKTKEKYNQIKTDLKNIKTILSPEGATDSFARYIESFLKK